MNEVLAGAATADSPHAQLTNSRLSGSRSIITCSCSSSLPAPHNFISLSADRCSRSLLGLYCRHVCKQRPTDRRPRMQTHIPAESVRPACGISLLVFFPHLLLLPSPHCSASSSSLLLIRQSLPLECQPICQTDVCVRKRVPVARNASLLLPEFALSSRLLFFRLAFLPLLMLLCCCWNPESNESREETTNNTRTPTARLTKWLSIHRPSLPVTMARVTQGCTDQCRSPCSEQTHFRSQGA